MKLLLVYLNNEYRPMVPINLTCIESYVKKHGHLVKVFDTSFYADILNFSNTKNRFKDGSYFQVDYSKYGIKIIDRSLCNDFLSMIEEYKPDLIGMSVYSYTEKYADSLAKAAKNRFPDIPIIYGGVHVTTRPQNNINKEWVDLICVGEGEMATLELCDRIEKGDNFNNIKNIWTKNSSMEMRELIDLNSIPFVSWDNYKTYHQYGPVEGNIYKLAVVEFGRGCPNSCTFCEGTLVKKMFQRSRIGPFVRHKTPEKFIEDCCKLIDAYGIEFFYISDGTFLTMTDSILEKLSHLWALKINKPFLCLSTALSITEKRARLLKEMRCFQVNIGIESGNEKIRNEIYKKPFLSNDKFVKAFHILKREKIRTSSFNIMGLPWENRSDIFDTIELNRSCKPDKTSVSAYIPFSGTELTEYMRKNGFVNEKIGPCDETSFTVQLCGDLTQEELKGLIKTFNLYCYIPKFLFPLLKFCEKNNKISPFIINILRMIFIKKCKKLNKGIEK